ncbi:MAG: cell division protein FtsZ [Pseudomonadota bacterium]
MSIKLSMPEITELKPRITVFGVGGAGGNAVNNMITSGLKGVDFVVANTDAQALTMSAAERIIQMGIAVTEGLGAGSQPEVGAAAAEEVLDEIRDQLSGAHMVFVTAGMGGGTGTGAAPVIARAAKDQGILTVGVVTKPFQFEGQRRMKIAEDGINELQSCVDTLIVIPNQNLFRVANEKTTFADAFAMADEVLYSGVACITDLMVKEGLINLDFADVRAVMREMGKAMMGTGEASGDKRAVQAAEAAISNPLLDDVSMKGSQGLLISITGGNDMTLFEVDEATTRIRQEVDDQANIIFGATFDETLDGLIRVSVVATGIDKVVPPVVSKPTAQPQPAPAQMPAAKVAAAASKPAATIMPGVAQPKPVAPAAPIPVAAAQVAKPQAPQKSITAEKGDVTIRRMTPAPSTLPAADVTLPPKREEAAVAAPAPFVPPVAEKVDRAQPRLPEIEDFPPIAQKAFKGAADASSEQAEKKGGLFGRIAAGLGIRDHDFVEDGAEPPLSSKTASSPHEPALGNRAQQATEEAMMAQKAHRIGARPHDDEQLEIPAFLRRQSK